MPAPASATPAAFPVIPLGKYPVAALKVIVNALPKLAALPSLGYPNANRMSVQPSADGFPGIADQTIVARFRCLPGRNSHQFTTITAGSRIRTNGGLTTVVTRDGLHFANPDKRRAGITCGSKPSLPWPRQLFLIPISDKPVEADSGHPEAYSPVSGRHRKWIKGILTG